MKQTCILILGMHRSGTSALTGVLELLGVNLGKKLLPAGKDNEKGYFENHAFYALNERLLGKLNSSWDDVFYREEILEGIKDCNEIRETISSEFEGQELFAIKDPRMAYLFPLYEEALQQLGIDIKVIIPYRNPAEVAKSLEKRNGFCTEKSMLLWASSFLLSEKHSRNYQRVFVDFDDLISKHAEVVGAISSNLSLDLLQSYTNSRQKIVKFLEPSLKHHNLDSQIITPPPRLVTEILQIKSELNNCNENEEFDRIRNKFFKSQEFFYNKSVINEIKSANKLKGEIKQQADVITRIENQLEELERKNLILQQEILLIYASRSWKMTKILRNIKRWIVK